MIQSKGESGEKFPGFFLFCRATSLVALPVVLWNCSGSGNNFIRNTGMMPVTNLKEMKRPRRSGSSAQHFVKGHEVAQTSQANTYQLLLSGIK